MPLTQWFFFFFFFNLNMSLSKLWEMVKDREARYAAVHGVAKSQMWLSNNNGLGVEKAFPHKADLHQKQAHQKKDLFLLSSVVEAKKNLFVTLYYLPFRTYPLSESSCVYQVPLQLAHLIGKWFFPFSQPYNISCSSNNIYTGQDTVLVLWIRLSKLLKFNHIFFSHAGYKLFEDRDWIFSCICSFQYWVHCRGERTVPINFNWIELNYSFGFHGRWEK